MIFAGGKKFWLVRTHRVSSAAENCWEYLCLCVFMQFVSQLGPPSAKVSWLFSSLKF